MFRYFCPGRVNLIGEHLDYNGGPVFPVAIDRGIHLEISFREDGLWHFSTANFPEAVTVDISEPIVNRPEQAWANYPLGVVKLLLERYDFQPKGLNLHYISQLPIGSGLSSSACIEVLTGFALADLFELEITRPELALLCQKAENEFIGVNCGIMDQYAVACGKAGHGMLLNCATLECVQVPLSFPEHTLMVMNTNKPRKLVESKYNERRAECEAAQMIAAQVLGKDVPLAKYTTEELDIFGPNLTAVQEKRARHVITEIQRVLEASELLEQGKIAAFFRKLMASHISLRDDYEVCGVELDCLVMSAYRHGAGLATRMTGAGFGGCALAFVVKGEEDIFIQKVSDEYFDKIGYAPDLFSVQIADGVKRC